MSGRSAAGWLVFALPTCHHQRPPVGGSSRNESLARDDRCKGEWRLAERATGRRALAAPSALIFLINRSTVDDECCYLRLSVFFPAANSSATFGPRLRIQKERASDSRGPRLMRKPSVPCNPDHRQACDSKRACLVIDGWARDRAKIG